MRDGFFFTVRSAAVALALSVCSAFAQTADSAPREGFRAALPAWLDLDPEARLRYEGRRGNAFDIDVSDGVLTRYLLGVGVRPHRRFRVYAQGMDARMPTIDRDRLTDRYRDTFEVREAFVEVGDSEQDNWVFSVGRRTLSYGDNRIVGPANWSNSRRAYDVARLRHENNAVRVDVLTGRVVDDYMDRPDRAENGNGLHGAYSTLKNAVPGAEVDLHLLYTTEREATDELGRVGDRRFWVPGVRIAGEQGRVDYQGDLILQTGSTGEGDLAAWSTFGRVGYRVGLPRVYGHYRRSSGDSDPTDGRDGSFDQLFPANHRHRGAADLVGNRNMESFGAGVDIDIIRALNVAIQVDSYRLASRFDAYYRFDGDAVVAPIRGGAEVKQLGLEFDLTAEYALDDTASLFGGVARFERGRFLRRYSDLRSSTFLYLGVEFKP